MKTSAVAGATVLCLLGGSQPVLAEAMLDAYLGGAFHDDSTIDYDTSFAGSGFDLASWDDSVAAGIRGGYWFEGPLKWFGLGVDLSYFSAEQSTSFGFPISDSTELVLLPVTPMAMVRVPLLASERYSGGRIAPYVGVGPGLFVSVLLNDPFIDDDVGFDVGLDLRAGVTTQLAPHFGLFVEYRRTDVDIEVEDTFGDTFRTNLQSDHVNAGVAIRF
jgi:opacity protein-like surface antigen